MKTIFKQTGLAILICLIPNLFSAQEILTGFNHRTTHNMLTRTQEALTLPFYDDFSNSCVYPDSTKWTDRDVFVNQGFPLNPVTRNAATLDVLDASGCVYPYAISNPFIAEHLTSAPIRLDSVFNPEPRALSPIDSLYFSFFYQPQGNGNPPESQDSLVLEFGVPSEIDTSWYHVWSTPGQTLAQFLQENDSNYFKQVMIPITDSRFFIPNFLFRFYNYASIANQSQPTNRGNEDNWNIDVVYLNQGRSYNDGSYPKISFTGPIPSFLKRYQSMPYKHYRANPNASITEEYELQLSNLDNQTHTIRHRYTVDQVNGNQSYSYPSTFPSTLEPQTYNQTKNAFVSQLFSMDYDRDSTSYIIRHYISDSTCNPPMVDSMVYRQGFYNYFAYDDGIPEMGYGVEPSSGAFAVQFELAEMDTLRGVQILFNHTLKDANNKYFDIVVWKDNNGKPGDEVYRLSGRKPKWDEQLYKFAYYQFDQRIRLNGVFYVGIVQQNSGLINVGFDTSNDNSQYNYFNVTGSWQNSTKPGSIMIRPVVGAGYYIGVSEDQVDNQISIYPNPATSTIHIEGIVHGSSITMYDLTGRVVVQRPYSNEISIEHLHNGLYFLNVTTADGVVIGKKIMVNR
ncbi:MAG: T9SS type A sorting domain-containing protein [Bacteroidales bacterium]|nr:T9SS type A sorting domain-containing protein [Bacteroidales bacterium]